ncbi:nucleotide sugar dehydrogenase [Candidatus Pelagibacter sp.]|jgi:UDP-N-acetyl-D-glucosamine/UDP-N-acetyl-D-galactosamine dehydrogenase|nr:nucleotide sugar dehydrogenase [Candidatus Pelagibacter sp.]
MRKNKIIIGVIGLGYVGTPLALSLGRFFNVLGFDLDKKRISELNKNNDITQETKLSDFKKSKKIIFSSEKNDLKNCNIFIITVPSPVTKSNKPDFYFLKKASKIVAQVMKKNSVIVYESTVYPGATEEQCIPVLEKESHLTYKKDFFCGYSPERINPGDKNHRLEDITKIISASDKKTLKLLEYIYKKILKNGVFLASSIKVAEAAKVIENTQRDLNIALMNELSKICSKLDIETKEVIDAAATKWNFHKYFPGLVGGHCIGVDPYYLTHKSKLLGYNPKIILAGRKLNDSMANYIFLQLEKLLKIKKINQKKLKILVLGITFKENCPDTRNSQSLKLTKLIKDKYNKVFVFDEVANIDITEDKKIIQLKKLKKNTFDVIILAVPHNKIVSKGVKKIKSYLKQKSIFLDLKGFFNKGNSDFRL